MAAGAAGVAAGAAGVAAGAAGRLAGAAPAGAVGAAEGALTLKPWTIASVALAAGTTWSTLVVTDSDTR